MWCRNNPGCGTETGRAPADGAAGVGGRAGVGRFGWTEPGDTGKTGTMSTQERISGIALLVDWANEQDHWVRALTGAVLESRRALTANVTDELYEVLLNEKNLLDGQPITVAPLERDLEAGAPEQSLRLTRLSEVANVNALAADQEIAFNPRMTVLYGENGAGKTGYVRVLKQLASVRTAEPILPNISQSGSGDPPHGSLFYELDDEPKRFVWSGEEGVPPFTRIDVFDARGVEIHVDGPLTYTYTPSEVAVFRHTHEAIQAVKERLDVAKSATQPSGNPYLNKFGRDGKLYVKIETLGATTDIEELERFGNVSDAAKSQLEPLKEGVAALRSGTSDAKLQLVKSERELLMGVKKTIETGRAFDVEAHSQATDAVAAAEGKHTHATQEALSGQPIPGVLEDSWRRFVEAGEIYLQEHYGGDYPDAEDSCPYCLQNLSAEALTIVWKYRAFCRSELKDAIQQARREVASLVDGVAKLELKGLQDDVRKRIGVTEEGRTPHASLVASHDALSALETVQTTVTKGEKIASSDELRELLTKAETAVADRLNEVDKLVGDLSTEVAKRKELLATELGKLQDLQDRMTLGELLPSILKHVASAKWASRANTILGRFRQLGKSLTDTSKLASEQLLNHNFETTFTAECESLHAPTVTLDFPGRSGQPARRKSLTPDCRLSAILSEGEQKVIALADFVAEATLRRSVTPLVFDDPVTSLDYKRLQYVVNRLVQLSETRQVIVFTHNIWFTMELLGRFDKDRESCSYYDISEDGNERGIVSHGESPKLDTWNDRKRRINLLLEHIRREKEKAMRDVLLEKGYDDLRGACEIVVEQNLLQKVVQSYNPNVMVNNLLRMKFDDLPSASATICDVFDRCCRFTGAHKQPMETLSVRPTLEKLAEDWRKLQKVHAHFS